ncbi:hypothetical protein [Halovivax cerinus]|uniref:Uncharacterized protein n=1 Tax=Halovivax cerinus TaxID=1487865 RepID=A0ABD5NPC0_9EURY|nr:hypothetical protein [Halovivax cerinus]
MTELEIPPGSDAETTISLVREFTDVGAIVRVQTRPSSGDRSDEGTGIEGEVTGFEPGYLELDGEGPQGNGIRWDALSILTRIESQS